MIYEFAIAQSTESAETYYTTEELGISGLKIEYVLAGLDVCSFTINSLEAFTDDISLFAYGNVVRLRRKENSISTAYEYLFLGRCKKPQRSASGEDETYDIQIFGMWDWFENTTYMQSWTEPSLTTVVKPRVVLFSSSNGSHVSTGTQIEECIQAAIDAGCPVASSSSGDIDSGFTPPFDEQINISIAQAVQKALAFHPHASVWFDYSSRTPRMYCKTRNTLPSKTLSIEGNERSEIIPRNDLVPPAIAIAFEKDNTVDDQTYTQTTIDYAPIIEGETAAETNTRLKQVDVLWAVYDLQGSTRQYLSQKVKVEPLPETLTDKTWWKAKCPELADIATEDFTLTNGVRNGVNQDDSELVEGAITNWMESIGVDSERETFTVEANITYKDGNKIVSLENKKLSVTLLTTNASNKTYKKLQRYDSGEEIPTGMASALWAEWQQMHYDGSLILAEQEPALEVRIGHCLNLSEGKDSWKHMKALVKRVAVDVDEGKTVVEFGVPTWIDIDSRVAWYRACRGRRYSMSIQQKTGSSIEDDEGMKEMQTIQDGAYRNALSRLHLFDKDGTIIHAIDMNLSDFAFETASDGTTARILKVAEHPVLYLDGDTVKAKLGQILCSDLYGDEIEVGGAKPPDPTNPKALGSTDEADLSSQAAYDPGSPETGKDGVALTVSLGSYYDHTAETPVLKDFRVTLTWPNSHAPKVSAVSTVEIDTPEASS